jgi:hypothetical protein
MARFALTLHVDLGPGSGTPEERGRGVRRERVRDSDRPAAVDDGVAQDASIFSARLASVAGENTG